jgi:hypothetical protein
VVLVRAERQHVRLLTDRREGRAPEHLDEHAILEHRQVELAGLCVARQVRDDQDLVGGIGVVPREAAEEREHLRVVGGEELDGPTTEHRVALAQRDHALHPPQQAAWVVLLGLDVDRLEVVLGVDDRRQEQSLGVRAGEAGVAVRGPLHRGAHAVAVAEVDVVAHPDLVAVVQDRGARQAEQQRVHQLDQPAIVAEQRREPAPDAEIDPHVAFARVRAVHVVAFLVGHHLERQLVVVAQEDAPLGTFGHLRGLLQDVEDREPVLLRDRHEQPRHQGKWKFMWHSSPSPK